MNAKQILRSIPALLLFFTTACEKKTEMPVISPVSAISKLEFENFYVKASYNPDGTLAVIASKQNTGTGDFLYTFQYTNGRVMEINYGGKWKYYYSGEQVLKVETYNEGGTLKYQAEFSYNGNRISEKLESIISSGIPRPYMRTLFTYNSQGNLSKKEVFQYINQQWDKSEEIQYPEYDNHVNTSGHLENNPYLPLGLYSVNNPLKEVFLDGQGTVLGSTTFTYTYDEAGRPVTRKSVEKYIGFPEYVQNVKLFY
jgi:hypothetical protein